MTEYDDKSRKYPSTYWVLYKKNIEGGMKYIIPKMKYIQFIIKNQNAKDIQNTLDIFYKHFILSCKYNLSNLPEIEYYHDGITEFLIPIEN